MKKMKKLIRPLLFILLASLFTGAALFFLGDMQMEKKTDKEDKRPLPEQEVAAAGKGGALAYKNETVYVVLDPGGGVVEQSIVNRIYCCDSAEKGMVKDYGSYREISNMTSGAEPVLHDNAILWDSELLRDGDIYYEGITDKSLPVEFEIDYYLDGDMMSAEALPGKSGKLQIVIKVKNKLKVEGNVPYRDYYGGRAQKQEINYVPLLVQGTYMADLNRFSEIEASDGMGIVTGQHMNVSFMAFPYPDAEITITMQGEDIELNQIMMVIVPQLPPIPEIDMEEDLQEMLEGVMALEEGLTAIYEGADELYRGLDEFRNKSNEIFTMMEPLLSLIEKLPGLFDEYLPEDGDLRSQVEELLDHLKNLPAGLPEIAEPPWIGELPDMTELPDMPEFPEEMPELPGIPELPAEMPELPADLREALIPYLEAVRDFAGSFDELEKHFLKAEETFEQLTMLPEALDQLAEGQKAIRDGIGEINSRGIMEMKKGIINGINENRYGQAKVDLMRSLAQDYRSHADNENNVGSSVQFVLQTESMEQQKPAAEKDDSGTGGKGGGPGEKAWYANLWSRFLALFSWISPG